MLAAEDGAELWRHGGQPGATSMGGVRVAMDAGGRVYIGGRRANGQTVVVRCFNADGSVRWQHVGLTSAVAYVVGSLRVRAGALVFAAWWEVALVNLVRRLDAPSGALLTENDLGQSSSPRLPRYLDLDAAGNLYLDHPLPGDVAIKKWTAAHNTIWSGPRAPGLFAGAVDPLGRMATAGAASAAGAPSNFSTQHVWLTSEDGQQTVWSYGIRSINGNLANIHDVAVCSDGDLVIVGDRSSTWEWGA